MSSREGEAVNVMLLLAEGMPRAPEGAGEALLSVTGST